MATIIDSKTTVGPFGGQGGAHLLVQKSAGVQSYGPFGGSGGNLWNDGVHTTVRQLIIMVGDLIDSIRIEYDKNGQSVWSPKHGESNGGKNHTVKLDYPYEFLISMSGYYETYSGLGTIIQSLTFRTNKRTYGPFGTEKGRQFSIPTSTNGMIVGFHGRSGLYLDSIGAYVKPIPLHHYHSLGPYGGQGGNLWDDGVYTTVRQLTIAVGDIVDSICIEYDKNGQSVWSSKHGKSNGGEKYTVKLDYPNEFLCSISGYYKEYFGMTLVHSLTFQTNKKTYGPFGAQNGCQFSTISNGGKIIGFHGRSGSFLDSIGVHLSLEHFEVVSNGPFGGGGGNQWNDGVNSTVRQLIVAVGDIVDSICIEYDKNGQSIWSTKHGESNGGEKYTVKLDYPNEFLISISGYYEKYFGMTLIQSLTFQTNKKTYGPFGAQKGCKFSIQSNGGRIVGFHGRSGSFLDSIGAYVEKIKPRI